MNAYILNAPYYSNTGLLLNTARPRMHQQKSPLWHLFIQTALCDVTTGTPMEGVGRYIPLVYWCRLTCTYLFLHWSGPLFGQGWFINWLINTCSCPPPDPCPLTPDPSTMLWHWLSAPGAKSARSHQLSSLLRGGLLPQWWADPSLQRRADSEVQAQEARLGSQQFQE